MTRIPIIAGNWKMNGLQAARSEAAAMAAGLVRADVGVDVVVCPPFTLLPDLARDLADGPIQVGGQDCHAEPSGARTGDVSAEMLADAGARFVIVGHSERRADHGDCDAAVRAKAMAVWRAGLTPIVCVGETLEDRKAGRANDVVAAQLSGSCPTSVERAAGRALIVAYEPVWAIGTGLTPSAAEIADMHGAIRRTLSRLYDPTSAQRTPILYGGSVKPDNAEAILAIADVDGALVGGASLKAADFLAIVAAAEAKATVR